MPRRPFLQNSLPCPGRHHSARTSRLSWVAEFVFGRRPGVEREWLSSCVKRKQARPNLRALCGHRFGYAIFLLVFFLVTLEWKVEDWQRKRERKEESWERKREGDCEMGGQRNRVVSRRDACVVLPSVRLSLKIAQLCHINKE